MTKLQMIMIHDDGDSDNDDDDDDVRDDKTDDDETQDGNYYDSDGDDDDDDDDDADDDGDVEDNDDVNDDDDEFVTSMRQHPDTKNRQWIVNLTSSEWQPIMPLKSKPENLKSVYCNIFDEKLRKICEYCPIVFKYHHLKKDDSRKKSLSDWSVQWLSVSSLDVAGMCFILMKNQNLSALLQSTLSERVFSNTPQLK